MQGSYGLLSSVPLAACTSSTCQNYTLQPDGVVVEFRFSSSQSAEPDWAGANDSIGGQLAVREDWGPVNAHDADEGHTWMVRLPTGVLTIYASLNGPNLTAGRKALQALLVGVVVGS
jgi:hypothetical protein